MIHKKDTTNLPRKQKLLYIKLETENAKINISVI